MNKARFVFNPLHIPRRCWSVRPARLDQAHHLPGCRSIPRSTAGCRLQEYDAMGSRARESEFDADCVRLLAPSPTDDVHAAVQRCASAEAA